MKDIRCKFEGHFYITVNDDATPDDIEEALLNHVSMIENTSYLAVDEYDWREIEE